MKAKLLLILLPLLVTSCSLLNLEQTDKKVIKSVKTEEYYYVDESDSNGTKIDSSLVTFNIKGDPEKEWQNASKNWGKIVEQHFNQDDRIINKVTKNHDGLITYTQNWEYDSNGNEVVYNKFDKNGELLEKYSTKFNAKNLKIEESSYNSFEGLTVEEYIYNPDGKLIQENKRSDAATIDIVSTYEYDSNGNILNHTKTDPEDDAVLIISNSYYPNNEIKQQIFDSQTSKGSNKVISDNNEFGNQIKRTTYHGTKLHQTLSYKYDQNNNEIFCYHYFSDTDSIKTSKLLNSYDGLGNLVEKKSYYEGELSGIETYKYNNADKEVEYLKLNANNGIVQKKTIQYDLNGIITRDIITGKDSIYNHDWEFVYDDSSKLVRENRYKNEKLSS